MYSSHNEGKSVVTERFIRTFKGKIYIKWQLIIVNFVFVILSWLFWEFNNTYHHSIDKKPIHADYSVLTEEIESSHKDPKFKVGDDLFWVKTNSFLCKVKNLNGE